MIGAIAGDVLGSVYAGARSTDDGVKAAATDAMRVMTGFAGGASGEEADDVIDTVEEVNDGTA